MASAFTLGYVHLFTKKMNRQNITAMMAVKIVIPNITDDPGMFLGLFGRENVTAAANETAGMITTNMKMEISICIVI